MLGGSLPVVPPGMPKQYLVISSSYLQVSDNFSYKTPNKE